jgi:hypothetical protein
LVLPVEAYHGPTSDSRAFPAYVNQAFPEPLMPPPPSRALVPLPDSVPHARRMMDGTAVLRRRDMLPPPYQVNNTWRPNRSLLGPSGLVPSHSLPPLANASKQSTAGNKRRWRRNKNKKVNGSMQNGRGWEDGEFRPPRLDDLRRLNRKAAR